MNCKIFSNNNNNNIIISINCKSVNVNTTAARKENKTDHTKIENKKIEYLRNTIYAFLVITKPFQNIE